MTNTCHVVGAGDFDPSLLQYEEGDLIIAADAGLIHLQTMGLRAHLFIGDGDSLGFFPEGIESVLLPEEKDDTDIHAAVREGLKRAYRRFAIHGALGGKRFSHSLANLQVLSFLSENGAEGVLFHPDYSVRLLGVGSHELSMAGGYFSLFDLKGDARVSVTGAKYPLTNALLPPHLTLGVSNEGTKHTRITVESGQILLVREP